MRGERRSGEAFASALDSFVSQELGHDPRDALSKCVFCKVAFENSRLTKSGKCEIKVLHCLHSACGHCLEQSLRASSEVLCPICDGRTDERDYNKYLCNFAVHQGIDYSAMQEQRCIACDECVEACPAVTYCEGCVRSLCRECSDHHRRSKATSSHALVTLRDQQEHSMHRAAFCPGHPDHVVEFFCETCSVMCCRTCILADHESHDYKLPGGTLVQKHRQQVRDQIHKLRDLAELLQERHQQLTRTVKGLEHEHDACRAGLEAMAARVRVALHERRRVLLQEIESCSGQHRNVLERKQAALTSVMVKMWHAIEFVEKVLARGTNVEVLFLKGYISEGHLFGDNYLALNSEELEATSATVAFAGDAAGTAARLAAAGHVLLQGADSRGVAADGVRGAARPAKVADAACAVAAASTATAEASEVAEAKGRDVEGRSEGGSHDDRAWSGKGSRPPGIWSSAAMRRAGASAGAGAPPRAGVGAGPGAGGRSEGGSCGGGARGEEGPRPASPAAAATAAGEAAAGAAAGEAAAAGAGTKGSAGRRAAEPAPAAPSAPEGEAAAAAAGSRRAPSEEACREVPESAAAEATAESAAAAAAAVATAAGAGDGAVATESTGRRPISLDATVGWPVKRRSQVPPRKLELAQSLLESSPGQPLPVARYEGVHRATSGELVRNGLGPLHATLGAEGECPGRFRSPCGLAVDSQLLYIADTLNHRIQVFNKTSHMLMGNVVIRGDSVIGQLQDPSGLCCTADRCLVVVEYGLDRVLYIRLAAESLEVADARVLCGSPLYGPFGVGFNHERVIVADSCNHRVLALTLTGQAVFQIGSRGSGPGQFEYPECVTVFSDGHFAISDKDNHRIQVFDWQGKFCHFIPCDWSPGEAAGFHGSASEDGRLSGPMGMGSDKQDRIYVCDCGGNRVQIFTRQGIWLWSSGKSSEFHSPTAMAIDNRGKVFVASDHCVQVFY